MLFYPNNIHAAPKGPQPFLESAVIEATVNEDHVAYVHEKLRLSQTNLIQTGKIGFTLSRINDIDVKDLKIKLNGKETSVEKTSGKALSKLSIPYDGTESSIDVEVIYFVPMRDGKFEIPMIVPVYASLGKESVVNITFTSPKDTYIYSNSFPVVPHMIEGNTETVPCANIPSHIKFEYGKEKEGFFNEFSVISYIVFLALVAIIVKWVHSEIQK